MNIDHLIYETQDILEIFKNNKLKAFLTETWVKVLLCVTIFIYSFSQIESPTTRFHTDALKVFIGASYRRQSLNFCVLIQNGPKSCSYMDFFQSLHLCLNNPLKYYRGPWEYCCKCNLHVNMLDPSTIR